MGPGRGRGLAGSGGPGEGTPVGGALEGSRCGGHGGGTAGGGLEGAQLGGGAQLEGRWGVHSWVGVLGVHSWVAVLGAGGDPAAASAASLNPALAPDTGAFAPCALGVGLRGEGVAGDPSPAPAVPPARARRPA